MALEYVFNTALFASVLKVTRIERGYSLRDLEAETKISISALSRIENNNMLDLETFVTLCNWLKISPGKFFENGDKTQTVAIYDELPQEVQVAFTRLAIAIRKSQPK